MQNVVRLSARRDAYEISPASNLFPLLDYEDCRRHPRTRRDSIWLYGASSSTAATLHRGASRRPRMPDPFLRGDDPLGFAVSLTLKWRLGKKQGDDCGAAGHHAPMRANPRNLREGRARSRLRSSSM
jgi:hypothetical protein